MLFNTSITSIEVIHIHKATNHQNKPQKSTKIAMKHECSAPSHKMSIQVRNMNRGNSS